MLEKTAKDIMTPTVYAVDPYISIREAAREMVSRGIGSLLVISEGNIVGIFTERDLAKAISQARSLDEPIINAMTKDVITVEIDDSISIIKEKMIKANIRHLPVVDKEGKPVGMISIKDLLMHV